jgi:hypothetical protein
MTSAFGAQSTSVADMSSSSHRFAFKTPVSCHCGLWRVNCDPWRVKCGPLLVTGGPLLVNCV